MYLNTKHYLILVPINLPEYEVLYSLFYVGVKIGGILDAGRWRHPL